MKILQKRTRSVCAFVILPIIIGTTDVQAGAQSRGPVVMVQDLVDGGEVDCSEAIQQALTINLRVGLPKGRFLVKSAIQLGEGQEVIGEGKETVLLAGVSNQCVFVARKCARVCVRELSIDGGGQTRDVYSGLRGVTGINFDAVSDYRIERVSITNCGVMRKGDTRDDGYHGGFGILITAQGGATRRGYLEKCAVSKIAGGGYFRGDGIYFGGNGSNEVNAVVRDCRVDEVGRHAFTVTSANGKALESNSVVFSGCTGSRTALSGLDVEGAGRVRVDRCCFERCGVDTKYYDAERVYGSEYRLMAGIACSNDDFQVIISDSQIDNSYYGITYGAVSELKIERVTVRNSSKADLALRLANGPKRALFNELQCLSSIGVQLGSTFANRELLVRRCIFAGPVKISGPGGGEFSRCDFQEGFRIAGRNVTLLRFFDCDFYARRGPGIGFDVPFARSSDCEVRACRFLGRDKMTFGIEFSPEAARRWSIIDSRFVGQSVAPLNITAEEAERSMITISSTVSLESPR